MARVRRNPSAMLNKERLAEISQKGLGDTRGCRGFTSHLHKLNRKCVCVDGNTQTKYLNQRLQCHIIAQRPHQLKACRLAASSFQLGGFPCNHDRLTNKREHCVNMKAFLAVRYLHKRSTRLASQDSTATQRFAPRFVRACIRYGHWHCYAAIQTLPHPFSCTMCSRVTKQPAAAN